eukprot:2368268-Prymnesium_polylepis.1
MRVEQVHVLQVDRRVLTSSILCAINVQHTRLSRSVAHVLRPLSANAPIPHNLIDMTTACVMRRSWLQWFWAREPFAAHQAPAGSTQESSLHKQIALDRARSRQIAGYRHIGLYRTTKEIDQIRGNLTV